MKNKISNKFFDERSLVAECDLQALPLLYVTFGGQKCESPGKLILQSRKILRRSHLLPRNGHDFAVLQTQETTGSELEKVAVRVRVGTFFEAVLRPLQP